jgi:hypothetical protein
LCLILTHLFQLQAAVLRGGTTGTYLGTGMRAYTFNGDRADDFPAAVAPLRTPQRREMLQTSTPRAKLAPPPPQPYARSVPSSPAGHARMMSGALSPSAATDAALQRMLDQRAAVARSADLSFAMTREDLH